MPSFGRGLSKEEQATNIRHYPEGYLSINYPIFHIALLTTSTINNSLNYQVFTSSFIKIESADNALYWRNQDFTSDDSLSANFIIFCEASGLGKQAGQFLSTGMNKSNWQSLFLSKKIFRTFWASSFHLNVSKGNRCNHGPKFVKFCH
jgi:hypothetical protein